MKTKEKLSVNRPVDKSEFETEKDSKNTAYAFILSDSKRFNKYREFNNKNRIYYQGRPFESDVEVERRCKNEAYAFILQENLFIEFGVFLSCLGDVDPHKAAVSALIDLTEKEVAV